MPIRLDERRKPSSVKVHVSSGAGVDITWSDGHASHYDFAYLREKCPCALCNDERQKKRRAAEKGKCARSASAAELAVASDVQAQTQGAGGACRRQLRSADRFQRRPL